MSLIICPLNVSKEESWLDTMYVALCNGRYVQLPVNVGMREAWEQPWQPLKAHSAGAAGAASNPDRQGTLTYNVSFPPTIKRNKRYHCKWQYSAR